MLRSIYITGFFLLALAPAWTGMAAPIQSIVDVERICNLSSLKPSASAQANAEQAVEEELPAGLNFFGSEAHAPADTQRRSKNAEPPAIASLIAARDHAINRGGVLMRTYTVRFDASDFELVEDPDDENLLVLHFPPTVPIFDNEAMIAWSTPTSLSFEVDSADAAEMLSLYEDEKLYLEAHVQLAAREAPQRALCRTHEKQPTVEFLLLEGTLHDANDQRALQHAVTDRYERAACEQHNDESLPDNAKPRVTVTNLSSIGSNSLSHTEGTILQLVTETDVHGCYMQALRQNSAMRGALVIEFSLNEEGHIENSGVVIDATNDSALTQCTISTLEQAEILRDKDASPLNVRVNLTFSR